MTKFKPAKCRTKHCRKLTTSGGKSPFCSRCRSRHWAEKHPVAYHFHHLRKRSKERGHEFKLTLAEYEHFWHLSGYAEKRGKTAKSLSIHRIKNERGYEVGNVMAVTLSWNSRLQFAPMPEWMKAEMMEAIKNSELKPALAQG